MGGYAVQLAAHEGAVVTATASARDANFVADLGARRVIDYTSRFETRSATSTSSLIRSAARS